MKTRRRSIVTLVAGVAVLVAVLAYAGTAAVSGAVTRPARTGAHAQAVSAKAQTKQQKLAKALKACKKDKSKAQRKKCESSARKKYGSKPKTSEKKMESQKPTGQETTTEPAKKQEATKSGESIFIANCGACHTLEAAGTTGHEGPNLTELKPSEETVKHQVTNGGGEMPAFGVDKILTEAEVDAVAKYVAEAAQQ